MASQTTLVDNAERESDIDSLLDTGETPAQGSEAAARPSAKALYVPSPLPMVELKQQLAREAEEEAASRSPTERPPPSAEHDAPIPPAPDPPRAPVEPKPPPPGFEKTIDRRFASVVDSDELSAKRAFPIVANPAPTPQLIMPGLQPMMAAVQPIEPTVQPIAATKPPTHKLRNALFALALGVARTTIGILHGDLTKADARNAMSMLRGAAQHVGARLQGP